MVNMVSSGFFATYGIRLLDGRDISSAEVASGARVAVVNEAFAREFFGGENPVGRAFNRPDTGNTVSSITIVGVAKDARYAQVRDPAPPTLYLPYASREASDSAEATFAVRTTGDPWALASLVRIAVRGVNPLLPIDQLRTQDAQIRELSATERMFALLSTAFSGLGLCLVLLGLYGVMSYTVLRRRAEIGLRMALGARPARVVRMILSECLAVAVLGVGLGLVAAFASARVVSNLLYGLAPTEPVVFAGSGAFLLLVALLAGGLPALAASRVDPMEALRAE